MRLKYALAGSVKFRHHGINEFSNFACGKGSLASGIWITFPADGIFILPRDVLLRAALSALQFFTCNSKNISTCTHQIYCVTWV